MKMNNKVAWITGGNSGLGLATAKRFVENGMKVMITSIGANAGDTALKELGENAIYVECDNTKSADLEHAIQVLKDTWGRLDVVVNSAGCSLPDAFHFDGQHFNKPGVEIPGLGDVFENYKKNIALNAIAPYEITLRTAELMAANEPNEWGERGCYVYISSGAATKYSCLSGASVGYGASKASQLGLVKYVARNLAPFGIRASVILPGLFKTGMVPDFMCEKAPAINHTFPNKIGDPDQIATMCVEIVKNSFINDTVITVDAGWHIIQDTLPE